MVALADLRNLTNLGTGRENLQELLIRVWINLFII